MGREKYELGVNGENEAARLLGEAGLAILQRNYRCPKGEADIIARDKEALVFVEVRTRSSGRYGWGEETITMKKRHRLQAVAMYYLLANGYKEWPEIRFDVIAIRWAEGCADSRWLRGI